MCGITGLWASNKTSDTHTIIRDMTNALAHRGPDGDGFWHEPNMNLHFGHRRLSIIDTSAGGAQPMHSSSGRYTLTYNGEFYNFNHIRAELEPLNPHYKGHSDTEVFLHAVDHWGIKRALDKIQGMFAFALWDSKHQTLTLARDRFGKKPLYIGWVAGDLVFSSELKSFHAHPDFQKHVSVGAQSLYMSYGYIPAPNTIFEGVWQLLPGHTITLSQNDLAQTPNLTTKMTSFWSCVTLADKMHDQKSVEDESSAKNTLTDLLKASVSRRTVSDVPLGAFLSGGIDSSLITAFLQSTSSTKVKTYSIGFAQDTFDEAPFAKDIAAHLNTDHHELYINGHDALEVISDLPDIYDEPFSDISSIPTILLSKFARESVTVALSGDGGDEMMGGYTRHISAPNIFKATSKLPKFAKRLFLEQFSSLPISMQNKLDKTRPFLSKDNNEDLFQRLLMHTNDHDPWVADGSHEPYPLETYLEAPPNDMNAAEMMILGDTLHTLPGKFLTKVDRASMAHSLEVRSPFLDPEIFEYAWSLPMNLKIRGRTGKWLLRQILKDHIPEALFDRPKQGFNIPLQDWLNNDLKDWAEDLLNEPELTQNNFNAFKVIRAWEAHKNGSSLHTNKIWAVCMYQCWSRKWL